MFGFLWRLFEEDSLSPHGICLLWRPELVWTHAVSDALIGTSYFSIPVALAYFVSKRRDLAFTWVFWAFAGFILACGTTHYFSIWTLWSPDYGIEALIKAITAIASVTTAIALWPLLPRALALPSPAQLREANAVLERRVRERDEAIELLNREKAERAKTEEMLRQSQKMEALGNLTGGIAHDFNNLLTVILGNLEAISARTVGESEAVRRSVRNAKAGAERAATLTQQLLAFGRKQSLQPVDLAANGVVLEIIDLLGRTLGSGITLQTDLAADLWMTRVDPNQLESALLNLAVNARDAMGEDGVLTIRTRNVPAEAALAVDGADTDGDLVVIEVADTGRGMDTQTKARAVEPFFTTKPLGKGSGLGLSQVQGFVAQSGGHVVIETALGKGTTIKLCLPRIL